MNRGAQFQSAWWSVELPASFHIEDGDGCVTLGSRQLPGILQISAARKDSGDIETEDLLDFAQDDIDVAGDPEPITFPAFNGLTLVTRADGNHIRKWWLASGRLLVFATYTSPTSITLPELAQVTDVLSTLQPIPES